MDMLETSLSLVQQRFSDLSFPLWSGLAWLSVESHLGPPLRPSVPTVFSAREWVQAWSVRAGKEGTGTEGEGGLPGVPTEFSLFLCCSCLRNPTVCFSVLFNKVNLLNCLYSSYFAEDILKPGIQTTNAVLVQLPVWGLKALFSL